MKKLQSAFVTSITFFVLAVFYPGFSFESVQVIIISALIYAFLQVFIRPILRILSLPLNVLTFGLFSLFIGVIILYSLSAFVTGFNIIGYETGEFSIAGWQVSSFTISPLASALVASALLSFLTSLLFLVLT